MEGNHQSLKTVTQRVVSLHLCHSDGHKSLGTQHGITQYMESKLYLQDTFFFSQIYSVEGRIHLIFFSRQSSRGQRTEIINHFLKGAGPKSKRQRSETEELCHTEEQMARLFCKEPDRKFFLTVWPQSLCHNSVVPQYREEVTGIGVVANNSLDMTRKLSLPALTTTQ